MTSTMLPAIVYHGMDFIIAAFVAIAAFLGMYVARVKENKGVRIPGRFDFADFKDRELSNRGVFDRTKWWK